MGAEQTKLLSSKRHEAEESLETRELAKKKEKPQNPWDGKKKKSRKGAKEILRRQKTYEIIAPDKTLFSANTLRDLEKVWNEKHETPVDIYDRDLSRRYRFCRTGTTQLPSINELPRFETNLNGKEWRPESLEKKPAERCYPFTEILQGSVDSFRENLLLHDNIFDAVSRDEIGVRFDRKWVDGKEWMSKEATERFSKKPSPNQTNESISTCGDSKELESEDGQTLDLLSKADDEKSESGPESIEEDRVIADWVEAIRDRRIDFEVLKVSLSSAANKWRALDETLRVVKRFKTKSGKIKERISFKSRRPSIQKFQQVFLQQLFLEMIVAECQDPKFQALELVVGTEIEAFLEVYLQIYKSMLQEHEERREARSHEEQLLRLLAFTDCSCLDGYSTLSTCGWDFGVAFSKWSSKTAKPPQEVDPRASKDALINAVQEQSIEKVTALIPQITEHDAFLGLLAAVQAREVDIEIFTELWKLIAEEQKRKLLLYTVSNGQADGLRLLLKFGVSKRDAQQAAILAAKRCRLNCLNYLLSLCEDNTLTKCLMTAVACDNVQIVRRLLPLASWDARILANEAGKHFPASDKVSKNNSKKLLEIWASLEGIKASGKEGEIASLSYCSNMIEMEMLIGKLLLDCEVHFSGKNLLDLHAGKGVALTSACIAQNFKQAVGIVAEEDDFTFAEAVARKLLLEIEDSSFDLNNLNETSRNQEHHRLDIQFTLQSGPEVDLEECLSEAHLILVSLHGQLDRDQMALLQPGCVVAYYRPKQFNLRSPPKALFTPLSTIPNPFHRRELLWKVFTKNDLSPSSPSS